MKRLVAMMALAGVMVAGCTEDGALPSEPDQVAGLYPLEQVNAVDVPATAFEGTVGSNPPFVLKVVATEGQMQLLANGTYLQSVELVQYIDGVLDLTTTYRDEGVIVYRNGEWLFTSTLVVNRSFTGTIANNRLLITQDLVGEGVPATYLYIE